MFYMTSSTVPKICPEQLVHLNSCESDDWLSVSQVLQKCAVLCLTRRMVNLLYHAKAE